MNRWFNIFAIWLIAIAIPVQGLASVATMNCVQTEHHQMDVSDHHHDMHQEHVTEHAHSHDTAKVDDRLTQIKVNTQHSCASCLKCTSCCSGFTFQSTTTNLFLQLFVKVTRFNDRTLRFIGFIPTGLERPPRPSLV